MARYIDADALLANLKKQYGEELGWWCPVNMSDVGMMIEDAPIANVAPIADTVRKMQERLIYTLCINNEENTEVFDYAYTLETIDQIAKEMLGEGK